VLLLFFLGHQDENFLFIDTARELVHEQGLFDLLHVQLLAVRALLWGRSPGCAGSA
jgi:hypothetical protein